MKWVDALGTEVEPSALLWGARGGRIRAVFPCRICEVRCWECQRRGRDITECGELVFEVDE